MSGTVAIVPAAGLGTRMGADKATLVVTATPNPNEMPSVQAYLQGVMPLLTQAGGAIVKRQKVGQVVIGLNKVCEIFLTAHCFLLAQQVVTFTTLIGVT